MAVRPIITNRAKVGIQASLGTGVAVSRILNSVGFSRPKPQIRSGEPFTAQGEQYPSAPIPSTKGHSELDCDGILTYNVMNFPFGAMFGNVAVVADGTNGKKRTYPFGNATTITPAYQTIEIGDANRAKKVIDAFGRSLTVSLSDMEAKFSMPMLAGARQDDVTPTTGGLTEYVPSIVVPSKIDVYVATTAAGLDTAETTGSAARFPLPLTAELSIPDLYNLLYRMNSSDTSFTGVTGVPAAPTLKFKTGDDDADFGSFLASISTGAFWFFRFVALGAVISGAVASGERWSLDLATFLTKGEEPDETDGAATNSFTFEVAHDATWGKAGQFQTISTLAAYTTP